MPRSLASYARTKTEARRELRRETPQLSSSFFGYSYDKQTKRANRVLTYLFLECAHIAKYRGISPRS